MGASPHIAVFTPDGRAGLVVSQGPGELAILDPSGRAVSGVVAVGKLPHWVVTSGDGRIAYVANEGSNDVTDRRPRRAPRGGHDPCGQRAEEDRRPAGRWWKGLGAGGHRGVRARAKLGSLAYSDHGTKDAAGQPAIELELDDYYFSPTFVRGTPGQSLTVELENESGTLHNMSMPGQNIDQDVPPHGRARIAIVFPASGAVSFHCKFHSAMGMNGQLLAGDAQPRATSAAGGDGSRIGR